MLLSFSGSRYQWQSPMPCHVCPTVTGTVPITNHCICHLDRSLGKPCSFVEQGIFVFTSFFAKTAGLPCLERLETPSPVS
ncbi:MAG: hypothetical protein EA399_07585 [Desulfovibrionales bacterium]|nr:MAG: hypothetical protein EA399_07585 [Desulfovibrionales bacterium]